MPIESTKSFQVRVYTLRDPGNNATRSQFFSFDCTMTESQMMAGLAAFRDDDPEPRMAATPVPGGKPHEIPEPTVFSGDDKK